MSEIKIEYTRRFTKQYKKLPSKTREQFNTCQTLFLRDPGLSVLHDHALSGKYEGYRSINITGDLRALYRRRGNTIIIFAFIGSHSELY